jgi:hypothetical protein
MKRAAFKLRKFGSVVGMIHRPTAEHPTGAAVAARVRKGPTSDIGQHCR